MADERATLSAPPPRPINRLFPSAVAAEPAQTSPIHGGSPERERDRDGKRERERDCGGGGGVA